MFYTHISDHYAPFHTRIINSPARDATYVLDGLLNHESELDIEEHYTDTAGFTDHVFALMPILGHHEYVISQISVSISPVKNRTIRRWADSSAEKQTLTISPYTGKRGYQLR